MEPPPELKRGPKVVRDALNELRRWTISQRPLPSLDCDLHDTPQGRIILPKPSSSQPPATSPNILPFGMAVVTAQDETKIRVYASTLAGGSAIDVGFSEGDDPPYLLTPAVGILQGGITIDQDGIVASRWLEIVSTLSPDSATDFFVEIGTVSQDSESQAWRVSNSRFGPISFRRCRNWGATEEPFYFGIWT